MGKGLKLLWNKEKNYMQLASVNYKPINEYNENMLSAMTLIGGVLMILPVLAAHFSNTKQNAIPIYLLTAVFFFTMFLIFKYSFLKKYSLGGLYICFSIFFSVAIYLSVVHTPTMRATILLGAFCIMPFGIIDRPVRINAFMAFWLMIHTTWESLQICVNQVCRLSFLMRVAGKTGNNNYRNIFVGGSNNERTEHTRH